MTPFLFQTSKTKARAEIVQALIFHAGYTITVATIAFIGDTILRMPPP
jgi:hypothetical protein